MILVDSDIPMYLVGAPHPHRADAQRLLEKLLAVERTVVERAKNIVLGYRQLSARDAVHLSVMEQNRIDQILSFDSSFDVFPGITRLS